MISELVDNQDNTMLTFWNEIIFTNKGNVKKLIGGLENTRTVKKSHDTSRFKQKIKSKETIKKNL